MQSATWSCAFMGFKHLRPRPFLDSFKKQAKDGAGGRSMLFPRNGGLAIVVVAVIFGLGRSSSTPEIMSGRRKCLSNASTLPQSSSYSSPERQTRNSVRLAQPDGRLLRPALRGLRSSNS